MTGARCPWEYSSPDLAHSQPSIVSVNPSLPLLEDAPDQPLPNDEAWIAQQQSAVASLASTLAKCTHLKHLTFTTRPGPETYLSEAALIPLLSLRNLTSLVLDAASSPANMRMGCVTSVHLCAAVNDLILHSPALRKIHLRLDRVCARLFEVPVGFDYHAAGVLQNLEEVVVNMQLAPVTLTATGPKEIAGQVVPCNFHHNLVAINKGRFVACGTKPGHRMEVEDAASDILVHAPKLRMLRIFVRGLLTEGGDFAYDLWEGRWLRLEPGAEWDAEGTEFVPRVQVCVTMRRRRR